MNLIIFTAHYPFKPGEDYLVQELEILSKYFKNITVICGEKNTEKVQRITPENIKVIMVNRKYKPSTCIFLGLKKMFSLNTVREIIYSINGLNNKINISMIKMILQYNVVSQRYVLWVKKNIKKNNTDTILYSYWLSAEAYALSTLKKEGYEFKVISRAHGYDAFLDRGYQAYRREIYQYLNEIHFVSDIARKQFKEKIILPQNNKRAVLFTSRLGTINQVQFTNKRVRKVNKIFHITTCSAIIPIKRLDILVDALTYLSEYRIKWTHFGEGSLKEELLKRIKGKIKSTNITVDFKGQVENLEILNFYENNEMDLFINVSDYEGVPVSIMEALSYSIPTIARDVGGNSEIVINNKNGILLGKEADAVALQRAIRYFINLSYENILIYKHEALKTWSKEYNGVDNYAKFAKQIIDISGYSQNNKG